MDACTNLPPLCTSVPQHHCLCTTLPPLCTSVTPTPMRMYHFAPSVHKCATTPLRTYKSAPSVHKCHPNTTAHVPLCTLCAQVCHNTTAHVQTCPLCAQVSPQHHVGSTLQLWPLTPCVFRLCLLCASWLCVCLLCGLTRVRGRYIPLIRTTRNLLASTPRIIGITPDLLTTSCAAHWRDCGL